MFKSIRIASAIFTTVFFSNFAFAESDHFYDAMYFAIEHFNADHSGTIESWGREHTFMHDLLSEVATQVPALKGVTRLGKEEAASQMFRVLEKRFDTSKPNGDVAAYRKLVDQIVEDCPYNRVTTIEESQPSGKTTKTVKTSFRLGDPTCASKDIRFLQQVKLDLLVVTERSGSFRDYVNFAIQPQSNVWQDMQAAKERVLNSQKGSALTRALVEPLAPPSFASLRSETDVQLQGSSGSAQLDDIINLKYRLGWGDCPAGCIHNHYWNVAVTPKLVSRNPTKYSFTVKVISETGDPVPAP